MQNCKRIKQNISTPTKGNILWDLECDLAENCHQPQQYYSTGTVL